VRIRSRTRLTLLVALVIGLVAACTSGSGTRSSKVSLEFWTINLKKNFNGYIEGLIHSYEGSHPNVKITWVDVPGDGETQKLLSAIAANKVPDVVNLTTPDLQQFAPSLSDLGKYTNAEQRSAYLESTMEPTQIGGRLVALPWYNAGAPISIFNADLARKAGLDPRDPPMTWDEALQWGVKIHQAEPSVYGMNALPDNVVLTMEGVPMLTPDGKQAAFNTSQAAQILDKWRAAAKQGAIAPGATVKNTRDYPQTLDNQQLAFSVNTFPFVLTSMQKNSPDVYRKLALAKGTLGSTGKYLLQDEQTFAIPAKSKHPQQAADFASYVTNAANQTAFCKLVPIYPSNKGSLKDPFFSASTSGNLTDQAKDLIGEELPQLQVSYLGAHQQDLLDSLSEHVRSFMTSNQSAQSALDSAAKDWDQILAGKTN
jgi:putative chitobiose transport system substrate-binding protein